MIPADTNRTRTVWPLADLFDALRREGFQLRPDDYLEVVRVLDEFQPQTHADLQALIAPLLVTSEEEQEKFDRVFETVQRKNADEPIPPIPKKRSLPWGWIITTLVSLLALGYITFLWPGPDFKTDIHVVGNVGPFQVGDTLVFAVDSSMQRAAGPMARWQWETPEGTLYPNPHEPTLPVVARRAGPLVVNLRGQHGRGLLVTTWTDSLRGIEYPVCTTLPVIKLDSVRLPGAPGNIRYRFTAQLVGPVQTVQEIRWQFDGAVVAKNQLEWERTIPARSVSSFHDVRVEAFRDTTQRLCFGDASLVVGTPASAEPPFTIDVRSAGALIVPERQVADTYRLALWLIGILLAVLVSLYFWLVIRDALKKEPPVPLPPDAANPLARFVSDEPPLEIPLENRENELVTRDQAFYRVVRSLRQPEEGDVRRLHISQTLQATMRGGGFPTLIFQPRKAERNYLFLIDRSQVRSQQVALFEYLFRAFLQENVCVERFFFHQTFEKFTNETHTKGVSLRQLATMYPRHIVLIWSNGVPLLYPPYPVVEPAIREAMAEWTFRAILTPVPVADWDSKERALQADFLLLPADLVGQLQLMHALAEQQTRQETYLKQYESDLYSTDYVDFRRVDDLRNYLGEERLQWLAALALYPRIRWEVVIELGGALLPPGAVNFTNLLKLARISWMQEGHFPDTTRLELLKVLRPDLEEKARQRLLQMFTYAEQYFPGAHFYDGEKYLLQTVNQFTLYAHDAEKYARYQPAQEAFKTLYEKGLYPDGAMLRYLENPGGNWTTLLPGNPDSVATEAIQSMESRPAGSSLESYLASQPTQPVTEPVDRPQDRRRRYILAGAGATLLLFLALLYMASKPENQQVNWDQQVPITIVLDTTACVTALNTSVTDNPRWTVKLDDSLFSITNLYATRLMPLRNSIVLENDINQDSATIRTVLAVTDTTAGGEQLARTVQFSRDTLRVRINCRPPATSGQSTSALRVSVEYTDANAPNIYAIQAFMNELEADKAYQFVRPLEPAVYAGNSQVRYFRPEDRDKAIAFAARASKALGMSIGTQFTKDARSPLTHLELWLNNGSADKPFSCRTVPTGWMDQFKGWRASAGTGYTIQLSGNQLSLLKNSPGVVGSGTAPAATGTIQQICQQNGVYWVRFGGKASQSLLIRNVTRSTGNFALVRLNADQLNGPQGQAYFDRLLKSAKFQRYSVPPKPQTQPLYNQSVQQTAAPGIDSNVTANQLPIPALSGTETARVQAQALPDRYVEAGIKAYQRGQYAQAVRSYDQSLQSNQLLAKNPATAAYVWNLKGYALFKQKRYEEAVTALLTATKTDPTYAWAYFDLARVYCALGRSAEAATASRQATDLRPGLREIMQNDREFMGVCGATAK